MAYNDRKSTDTDLCAAWRLFLHARQPSAVSAERLVNWLGEDPKRVYALDEALTLWALAGGALKTTRQEGVPDFIRQLQ